MVTIIEILDILQGENCRTCACEYATHDPTGIEVKIECNAAHDVNGKLIFYVTATCLDGSKFPFVDDSYSLEDEIEFTIHASVLCYNPCEEEFWNEPGVDEDN